MKLDSFTQGYIDCALWSSTGDNDEPLDENHSIADFAPETLAKIIADCERFQSENEIPEYNNSRYSDAELAGHDFWLTRNRHGAGFWDGDIEEAVGKRLTEAAHQFGEINLYVGDDGLLYLTP